MQITIENTNIKDVVIVIPEFFEDERGFFSEIYRKDQFKELGLPNEFVQLNHSRSSKNVLRGLHFQWDPPMGKLMRVIYGIAFLVAVDVRKGSPTLGKWFGMEISAKNGKQVWAPEGFARGYCVLSEVAEIEYLCTGTYNSKGESGVLWNDPEIGIAWPIKNPLLSKKDMNAQSLSAWLKREESNSLRYDV
jgi:dTDP-4-dehydrorhamnose 3,5-epimerase